MQMQRHPVKRGIVNRGAVATVIVTAAAWLGAGTNVPARPGAQAGKAAADTPFNLVFILTDQQRRDTMGAYGNSRIHTPNLNALAARSVVFERPYVTQPLCTPARASLLTGLYPHTHGAATNNARLPAGRPILPELLPSGYRSAWFGKWHLGDEIFQQRGFDEFESTEDGYDDHYTEGRDRAALSGYARFLRAQGVRPDGKDGSYSRSYANTLPKELSKPAYVTGKGLEFIDRHRERPFAVFLSYLDPHTPFNSINDGMYDPSAMEVPPTFHEPLDPTVLERTRALRELLRHDPPGSYKGIIDTPEDLQRVKARYWGKVTLVDEMVGRIQRRLADLDLDDRTIVVFTSEHGELMGAHRLMFKSLMYEESATVPLLLRVPGVTERGRRVATPVSQVDLAPTLLDLMDGRRPEALEGSSWAPALRTGAPFPEEDVFLEFNGPPWPYKTEFTDRLRTIVTPDGWKMTVDDRSQGELYNLRSDPEERDNLFYESGQLARVRGLLKRIHDWQRRTADVRIRFDEGEWRRNGARLRKGAA